MQLKIETKSWKLTTNDDGQKIIAGEYEVKCGKEVVASKSFNDGYGCIKIVIPATIVAKVEALDVEIRQTIIDSFEK